MAKSSPEKLEYMRQWRTIEANKKRQREHGKRWRESNLTRARETRRRWLKANPLKRRQYDGLPIPDRGIPAVCDCCGKKPEKGKSLSLDHDHRTGIFRGWICNRCNLGIGLLGDSYEAVQQAAHYLYWCGKL